MRRIIITGARDWPQTLEGTGEVAAGLQRGLALVFGGGFGPWTAVVGDCPTGVDAIAKHILDDGQVEVFAADWKKYGRTAGPLRNAEMVDSGADIVVAFPTESSKGTWDCLRKAVAAGIPTLILPYRGE